jgi:hypothetical protein
MGIIGIYPSSTTPQVTSLPATSPPSLGDLITQINSYDNEVNNSTTGYKAYLDAVLLAQKTGSGQNQYLDFGAGTSFMGNGENPSYYRTSPNQGACSIACRGLAGCTGATWAPLQSQGKYCYLATGNGAITKDTSTTEKAAMHAIMSFPQLVDQFAISSNTSVRDAWRLVQQKAVLWSNSSPDTKTTGEELDTNYGSSRGGAAYTGLLKNRNELNNLVNGTLLQQQKLSDAQLRVDQANTNYILWFVTLIVFAFYAVKMIFFPNIPSMFYRHTFWLALISVFIILTTRLNSAPAFILWLVILFSIGLMQFKVVPSP